MIIKKSTALPANYANFFFANSDVCCQFDKRLVHRNAFLVFLNIETIVNDNKRKITNRRKKKLIAIKPR